MANRFWVGGTASWNGTALTKWATTSGGAGGAAIPTSADDVFLDGASGAVTVTIAAGNTGCKSLTCTGFTGTLDGSQDLAVANGSLTLASGMTFTYSGTFAMTPTGNATLTSAGKSFAGNISINASAGISIQLQDAFTNGTGNTITLTQGTLDLNGKAVSIGRFSTNNTNTRSITSGGATISLTGNGASVWSAADVTGFTLGDALQLDCTYSGATGTRTLSHGSTAGTEVNSPSVKVSAGTDIVTLNSNSTYKNIDFTGFAGSVSNVILSIYGNLTLASGATYSAGTLTWTMAATSGTKTITSNGKTMDFSVTFNGVGGTWQLADAMTVGSTRTMTLTNGTFDMNGKAVSVGVFSSNNANTRSLTSGGATMTLTGNATQIWGMSIATGFVLNDALQVDCTYSGSTGTRTLNHANSAGGTETNCPSVKISAGTDVISLSDGGTCCYKNVDLTGFAGSDTNGIRTIYGNLTIASGMTVTAGGSTTTFGATSGTKTIASNGKTMDYPVTFNGVGGTWQLADAMTLGSTRTTTLTNGTLDVNGKTLSTGRFSSSNANARTIKSTAAGGKIATTDTTAATVFTAATATNLTVTRNSWTIEIGGNTTNIRTANIGAGITWPALSFTNTTASGELDIVSSGVSTVLKSLAVSTAPQTIKRSASTTITIEDDNGFPSGTAGNLVTIGSLTAASHTWTKSGSVGSGNISSDYLSISRSTATPTNTWLAGSHSTDGGNNLGWVFSGRIFFAPRFL